MKGFNKRYKIASALVIIYLISIFYYTIAIETLVVTYFKLGVYAGVALICAFAAEKIVNKITKKAQA